MGKTFALTDPLSNTGCLVPKCVLAQRGHTAEVVFGGTFFTHGHDNSICAVAEGLADGAAVDQLIWDFMDATDHRERLLETVSKWVSRQQEKAVTALQVNAAAEIKGARA